MKKISKFSHLLTVALLFLIVMSAVPGHTAGMITVWEPFKTKTELGSYTVRAELNKMFLFQDEFDKTESIIPLERYNADKRTDGTWNILKYHNVSLSFSHLVIQEIQVDAYKSSGEGSKKWDVIKTFPSIFLTSPPKDTVESVGRVFEPEVKLKVEF